MRQELTAHAKKRMQQRGFSGHALDMILHYGRYTMAPGGAIKIFFGNKDHQELVACLKKDIQLLDKAKGGTVILSEDGMILTTYKNT